MQLSSAHQQIAALSNTEGNNFIGLCSGQDQPLGSHNVIRAVELTQWQLHQCCGTNSIVNSWPILGSTVTTLTDA